MPITFPCPLCDNRVSVSRRYAGRQGICPGCREEIPIPTLEAAAHISEVSEDLVQDSHSEDTWADLDREHLHLLCEHEILTREQADWCVTSLETLKDQGHGAAVSALRLLCAPGERPCHHATRFRPARGIGQLATACPRKASRR